MAFFFEIPSFILKVCEMITFLVWDDEDSSIQIDDRALFDVIEKMTACEIEVDLHHPLLVPSLIYLNDCTSTEIRNILEKFANEPLFPPISHHRLKPINDSLKIVGEICILEIWDDFADLTSPASCLSMELSKLLVESAKRFENTVKYAGFLELYTKLHNLWARLNEESKSYQIFFNQFDINYIKTSVKALENTVFLAELQNFI
ncbi:unnamed protein product [Caenorhabditis angaria]|uniref:Uncharacterized protein n=1 Tax=Caenorhabditis angaria TaxID=860376 RepID=A0A9P1I6E9_9PELO|nr:unnamed protein product [Caenorhabditis angaria]